MQTMCKMPVYSVFAYRVYKISLFYLLLMLSTTSMANPKPIIGKEVRLDGVVVQSLEQALQQAQEGSYIQLSAGVFHDGGVLTASFVTIEGTKGTHLKGFSTQGKGALVIKGDSNHIKNIECSHVKVSHKNGACVRFEGTNLMLNNVYFHDSEQGLLTGKQSGVIVIENSRFERLGKAGQAHGIYVGSGELYINNSVFLSGKDEGHEIKSRASKTVIRNTIIASLLGRDSRLIDVPNGGILHVFDSVLQQGNNTRNWNLIGYGLEGIKHSQNEVKIINNTFFLQRKWGNKLFHSRDNSIKTLISDNTIIGKLLDKKLHDANQVYTSSAAAGVRLSIN